MGFVTPEDVDGFVNQLMTAKFSNDYTITDTFIRHHDCGTVSFNPENIKNRYCKACNKFLNERRNEDDISKKEQDLSDCAKEVEGNKGLNHEMKDWDITVNDGLDDKP